MLFAFCLFVACFVAHSTAQSSCKLWKRCPTINITIPECTTDIKSDEMYICVENVIKDCHNHVELMMDLTLIKRTNDAFCRDETLNNDYKKNRHCWGEFRICAADKMNFLLINNNINNNCTQYQIIKDECLFDKKCKNVNGKFIDAAFPLCYRPSNASLNKLNLYLLLFITKLLIVFNI